VNDTTSATEPITTALRTEEMFRNIRRDTEVTFIFQFIVISSLPQETSATQEANFSWRIGERMSARLQIDRQN